MRPVSALEFLHADTLAGEGLVHAFTTRSGGTSEGPYDSLNLTWSRGDDKAKVAGNRARVTEALGLDRLVFADQVHGRTVLRVDAAPTDAWAAGEGDALMTGVPGLGLCAQCADCVPILLFDPDNRAIAAVHSGWRGAVQNIAGAAVSAMASAYGTRREALSAAIGPCISAANYRVGPEVLDQFEARFGSLEGLAGARDGEGGAGLDVGEACRRQLIAAGLEAGAIARIEACTFADEARFFSSRRAAREGHAGQFGGQCGIIALR